MLALNIVGFAFYALVETPPGAETEGSMKTSWKEETDRLVCRWSPPEELNRHSPPWLAELSTSSIESPAPPVPDFAAHSPLGSGEWFVPWNARWSLPWRA